MLTKKFILPVTVVALLAGLAFVVHAHHAGGDDHGSHEHGGHEGHAAQAGGLDKLTLDNGAKWQTDAPLREQMSGIRADMAAALDGIRGNTFTLAQYQALAASIQSRVNTIFSKCRLPPEVDAQAHFVLMELMDGVGLMKEGGDRSGGAVKVVHALAAYGKYFDHPDWQPLEH